MRKELIDMTNETICILILILLCIIALLCMLFMIKRDGLKATIIHFITVAGYDINSINPCEFRKFMN